MGSDVIVFDFLFLVAVDDKRAIQVIELVLEGDGKKARGFQFSIFAAFILKTDRHSFGAFDRQELARETETAFFENNFLTRKTGQLRVDKNHLFVFDFNDAEPEGEIDLRSGETESIGFVHHLEHFGDERLDFRCEGITDFGGFGTENGRLGAGDESMGGGHKRGY